MWLAIIWSCIKRCCVRTLLSYLYMQVCCFQVDSTLQCMMNESSLDYASKFADLAAQIAAQDSQMSHADAHTTSEEKLSLPSTSVASTTDFVELPWTCRLVMREICRPCRRFRSRDSASCITVMWEQWKLHSQIFWFGVRDSRRGLWCLYTFTQVVTAVAVLPARTCRYEESITACWGKPFVDLMWDLESLCNESAPASHVFGAELVYPLFVSCICCAISTWVIDYLVPGCLIEEAKDFFTTRNKFCQLENSKHATIDKVLLCSFALGSVVSVRESQISFLKSLIGFPTYFTFDRIKINTSIVHIQLFLTEYPQYFSWV